MSGPSDRPGLVADLFAIIVAEALVGVDLSEDDWRQILSAHCSDFSGRRALFGETARQQVDQLASGVYHDDEGSDTSADLAQRIEALPIIQKIAVLDVIDRYWSPQATKTCDLRMSLEALGVVFAETGHQRLRAAAARASWRQTAVEPRSQI